MKESSKSKGPKGTRKTVVITGGSHGIGRELVEQFDARGYEVLTCGTSRVEFSSKNIKYACIDVSNPFHVETWLSEIDRIDILINNAGILGERGPVLENDFSSWAKVLKVNVNGPFFVTKVAKEKLFPGAVVINISSSVGRSARSDWGGYSVSKCALEAFTDILSEELNDIIVFSVNPGGTATKMRAEAFPDEDPNDLPSAEKIASVIVDWAMRPAELNGLKLNCRDELLLG